MTRRDFPPPPAWVEPPEPHDGLDLLGLRNPVQRVGNHCMDGVTTITPAIRYLGVYCWALRNYWQQARPDAESALRAYLDRVEFAVVLGSLLVEPGMPFLLGARKARALIHEGGPFEVEALVSQNTAAVYGSVVEQLGLVEPGERAIRHLTAAGKALADATGAAFEASALGRAIAGGDVPTVIDRPTLADFGAHARVDRPGSAECDLLGEIVVPSDPAGVEAVRRAHSYGLALSLCEELGQPPTVPMFFQWVASDAEVPAPLVDARTRWRHFLTRDLLAVAHEVTLERIAATVERREGGALAGALIGQVLAEGEEGGLPEEALPRDAGQLVVYAMAPNATIVEVQRRLDETTHDRREIAGCHVWHAALDEERLIRALRAHREAAPLLLPLVWLLTCHRWRPSIDGETLAAIDGAHINRLGLRDVIAPTVARWVREGTTVRHAAAELAWRTVDQHLRIVWSRRRTLPRDADAAVLVVDGDRWRARRAFHHGRTGSRLEQAFGWISTLVWWDASGLTDDGRRALSRALQAGGVA